MCLIIVTQHPKAFTREHLEDFFQYNSDGLGVMYYDGPKLLTAKWMAESAPQAKPKKRKSKNVSWQDQALESMIAFWNHYAEAAEQAGGEFAAHFRMRTHGDIDHENCHPYPIADGAQLMHNGILKHGNHADTSKSDTWHYAEKLRPLVEEYGTSILRHPAMQEVISDDITGSNRFVLGAPGWSEFAILNKNTGVEFNGAWLSNTYAWSADRWMPARFSAWPDKYSRSLTDWTVKEWSETFTDGQQTGNEVDWEAGSVSFLANEYAENPELFWQDLLELNPITGELQDYLAMGEATAKQDVTNYPEELAELVWLEGGPLRWEQEATQ